jgi:glucuronokinase
MEARARGTAYARAALVGNPSDGYGGAVVAVTIRNFAAEVMLEAASEMEVEPVGASDLVRAAVARFSGWTRTHAPGSYRATCRTSIPRQVGLAGSSAILVATLRALCELHETEMEADDLAGLAWRAETQDVGYPAGGQDPYAQAHEGLVLMDFSSEVRVERLDPADLPPLFLAYRVDAASPSSSVHTDLRARLGRDDATVRPAIEELAGLAREAGGRLRAGRTEAIGELMTATFELRRLLLDLEPRQARMVEIAREHDADANYTGSGGAIIATRPSGEAWPALRLALESEGCAVIEPALS